MKKTLTYLFVTFWCLLVSAQNIMTIQGNPCTFDTVAHRHIAPGSTYTTFQLDGIKADAFTYKMRVHLVSVDLRNPHNTLTPYLANDTYYAINKQTEEVARQKEQGLKPVASINGGLFVQGNSTSAVMANYEISGGMVTEGRMRYEQHRSSSIFYITKDGGAGIEDIVLKASVSANGTSAEVRQINHFRDVQPDGISLFCNKMPRAQCSTEKASVGRDVRLSLLTGDEIRVGKNVCVVTEVLNGGRHSMSETDVMLSSEKGDGLAYLSTLKAGDRVEIDIAYQNDLGKAIDVYESMTNGFGYAVKKGVPQTSRFKNYAIAALGISQDGLTAYFADMEISANSNATVNCFAEMLANIGLWDAIWLDGGPSAEMTLDGEFVTVNSIGKEFNGRHIPSGFILYSTAPDDSQVTSIETDDSRERVLRTGESFNFNLFGYNKYKEMVEAKAYNLPVISITCPEELGTIQGNRFTATGVGRGCLTIRLEGEEEAVTIPFDIRNDDCLEVFPKSIFTGQDRQVQTRLYLTRDNTTQEIEPSLATWTMSNKYVVRDCTDGLITPFIDGRARVVAEYEGLSDTISVLVENLEEDAEYINLNWNRKEEEIHIPSVPYCVDVRVRATGLKAPILTYSCGEETFSTSKAIPLGKEGIMSITPDYDSAEAYPVTIRNVSGGQITDITAFYTPNYQETADGVETDTAGSMEINCTDGSIRVTNNGLSVFHGSISLIGLGGQEIQKEELALEPSQARSIQCQQEGCLIAVLRNSNGQIVLARVALR